MFTLLLALALPAHALTKADLDAYQAELAPLLGSNTALGKQFLDVASQVKQGKLDGAGVAGRFAAEAVPVAQDLATKVAAVRPADPQLAEAHALLVKAWADRAAVYADIDKAWKTKDTAALTAAKARQQAAHDGEEAWLGAVNTLGSADGVSFDLYP